MSTINTASASATIGSLFGTTVRTLNTVSNLVDSVNTYASKLQLAAEDSLQDQQDRSQVHRERFRENLILEVSEDEAAAHIRAKEFQAKSPEHAEAFNEAYKKFSSIFDKSPSKKSK